LERDEQPETFAYSDEALGANPQEPARFSGDSPLSLNILPRSTSSGRGREQCHQAMHPYFVITVHPPSSTAS
jgi:hypothetical protein